MSHAQAMKKTRARNTVKKREKISIDFMILSIFHAPHPFIVLMKI